MEHNRTIKVKITYVPEFLMTIPVPTYRDDEEFIDEFIEGLMNNNCLSSCDWDFVD